MTVQPFTPREGGVKIVFDVPAPTVGAVMLHVIAAGFVARPYDPDEPNTGSGWVRIGAERAMQDFTDAERDAVLAEFDAAIAGAGFACRRVGTDVWTAGDGGTAGVREPRRPRPTPRAGIRHWPTSEQF